MEGSAYCGPHNPEHIATLRPCKALTKSGKSCNGGAIKGTDLCLSHTPHKVGVAKVGTDDGVTDVAYRRYLQSWQWKVKRMKRLKMDGMACVLCDSSDQLQVHHVTYDRLGFERLSDLRTLCRDCHEAISEAENTIGRAKANSVFTNGPAHKRPVHN